jgi:hypothetical protein
VARIVVCRNIKTLHNFKPPATEEEIRASSLQFVRKLSGFTRPSKANQLAFNRAVDEVAKAANELLAALVTNAPPRDRAVEASRAQARAANRFSSPAARHAT